MLDEFWLSLRECKFSWHVLSFSPRFLFRFFWWFLFGLFLDLVFLEPFFNELTFIWIDDWSRLSTTNFWLIWRSSLCVQSLCHGQGSMQSATILWLVGIDNENILGRGLDHLHCWSHTILGHLVHDLLTVFMQASIWASACMPTTGGATLRQTFDRGSLLLHGPNKLLARGFLSYLGQKTFLD